MQRLWGIFQGIYGVCFFLFVTTQVRDVFVGGLHFTGVLDSGSTSQSEEEGVAN